MPSGKSGPPPAGRGPRSARGAKLLLATFAVVCVGGAGVVWSNQITPPFNPPPSPRVDQIPPASCPPYRHYFVNGVALCYSWDQYPPAGVNSRPCLAPKPAERTEDPAERRAHARAERKQQRQQEPPETSKRRAQEKRWRVHERKWRPEVTWCRGSSNDNGYGQISRAG